MKVIESKIPIKSWCENIESGAMEQAVNLSLLPFAFKHIALMPDCHQGYGMPIGGVAAFADAIVPNCVGVDIGCGMRAVRTSLTEIDRETILRVFSDIRAAVPVGFNHHAEPQEWHGFDDAPDIQVIQEQLESARCQLGTLGGGNHFIELQSGSDGHIWIMLHSGSRNFGYKIAKIYHETAKKLCDRWCSVIPTPDLAFLPIGTKEARDYIEAMNYALLFARASRHQMMRRCMAVLQEQTECDYTDADEYDIHHNYAAIEHHYGRDVWVHRKGATRARIGEYGIIPGSQGTASYIVTGKGNRESFESCSHGAGRTMGRKEATRTLDLDTVKASLESRGIVHSIRGVKNLDEAPEAYKDIDTVMAAQSDLVDIAVTLTPLGCIKG